MDHTDPRGLEWNMYDSIIMSRKSASGMMYHISWHDSYINEGTCDHGKQHGFIHIINNTLRMTWCMDKLFEYIDWCAKLSTLCCMKIKLQMKIKISSEVSWYDVHQQPPWCRVIHPWVFYTLIDFIIHCCLNINMCHFQSKENRSVKFLDLCPLLFKNVGDLNKVLSHDLK